MKCKKTVLSVIVIMMCLLLVSCDPPNFYHDSYTNEVISIDLIEYDGGNIQNGQEIRAENRHMPVAYGGNDGASRIVRRCVPGGHCRRGRGQGAFRSYRRRAVRTESAHDAVHSGVDGRLGHSCAFAPKTQARNQLHARHSLHRPGYHSGCRSCFAVFHQGRRL